METKLKMISMNSSNNTENQGETLDGSCFEESVFLADKFKNHIKKPSKQGQNKS